MKEFGYYMLFLFLILLVLAGVAAFAIDRLRAWRRARSPWTWLAPLVGLGAVAANLVYFESDATVLLAPNLLALAAVLGLTVAWGAHSADWRPQRLRHQIVRSRQGFAKNTLLFRVLRRGLVSTQRQTVKAHGIVLRNRAGGFLRRGFLRREIPCGRRLRSGGAQADGCGKSAQKRAKNGKYQPFPLGGRVHLAALRL